MDDNKVMNDLQKYYKSLKAGATYRREFLSTLTQGDTDYLLKRLCEKGLLRKLQQGLYYRPALTDFGEMFPQEHLLIEGFLKSNLFLCISPNDYNSLGLGTTQLYNMTYVYNSKRNGIFEFLGRKYRFIKKFDFPSKVTTEFLIVDLLNNLKLLAEDEDRIKENLKLKVDQYNTKALSQMAARYGKIGTKKFIRELLNVSA